MPRSVATKGDENAPRAAWAGCAQTHMPGLFPGGPNRTKMFRDLCAGGAVLCDGAGLRAR